MSGYRLALIAFLAFSAVGCGSGSGSGSGGASPVPPDPVPVPTATQPATVGVLLTDAPAPDIDEAVATITSVALRGEAGEAVLFSGNQQVDLLRLDFFELFTVSNDVRPGRYDTVRLVLSDLRFIRRDDNGTIIETLRPLLPADGKIDVRSREPFTVAPGARIFIELDFDMQKALELAEMEDGVLKLRPVIFARIGSQGPDARLARVHGEIMDIEAFEASFRLCRTSLVATADGGNEPGVLRPCVKVFTDEDTGIFDADGLPVDYSDLEPGDEVTVVGRIRGNAGFFVQIPAGHLPPPGECRLWYPDRPDGQQPPPGNCRELAFNMPPGAVLIDHYGRPVGVEAFALDAAVIEGGPLGTFRRLAGMTVSDVDSVSDRFELLLDPGQGFVSDTIVVIQTFVETRIFSHAGTEIGLGDIGPDRRARVDGVLRLGNDTPDLLRAALVLLDTDGIAPETALRGEILSIDFAVDRLLIATVGGDRCIRADHADVFLVTIEYGALLSRPGDLDDLEPRQPIDVFGSEAVDGCFVGETIITDAG